MFSSPTIRTLLAPAQQTVKTRKDKTKQNKTRDLFQVPVLLR
jgi:hypothetical protein